MKGQGYPILAAIALACASPAAAQSVYKSVDAQGRVTYSSSPPSDAAEEMVERVPIAPGPTDQQQQEAAQRARALQAAAKREAQERQAQAAKAEKASSEAQQALRRAEIALQEAQIKGDDDWQTLATGGRVLKQDYLDRVKDAEQRVRQAQEAARGSQSSRR